MMTDHHPLSPYIRRFLVEHVVADRCLSVNTRKSYRDAIRLLVGFLAEYCSTDPTRLTVEQVTSDAIRSFLSHLETKRGNSASTRNQRLATIHSLFSYIGRRVPELLEGAAQIKSIPRRRAATPMLPYLEKNEMHALLETPDRECRQGQRDYALLLFLYNTGARAQEAASATVGDIEFGTSACIRIHGKGGKTRVCPLWPLTVTTLRDLISTREHAAPETPVFLNVRRQPITRFGIYALVERTADRAAEVIPSLRGKRVSPHTMRHTTAVHLLRAGVDINTIRAWLGHVSLETTNRYAQVDLEMKAKALATCAVSFSIGESDGVPEWRRDDDLMAFLASL
jgi:site-specific recombinase XerD